MTLAGSIDNSVDPIDLIVQSLHHYDRITDHIHYLLYIIMEHTVAKRTAASVQSRMRIQKDLQNSKDNAWLLDSLQLQI